MKTRPGRPGKSEVEKRKARLKTYDPTSDSGTQCHPLEIDDIAKLAIGKCEAAEQDSRTSLIHAVARSCIISSIWINTRTKNYSGISKTTAAAQKLNLDFQEFADASANVIAHLNPQRSPKFSDEKIVLQIRKIQLQQEKSKVPSLTCVSYFGMVAHLSNSKMKQYLKKSFIAPSEDGYVLPTSFDSANVFRSLIDSQSAARYQIGAEMIDKILTTAIRSKERYFEDGPDDVLSLASEFDVEDVPICNWETKEKFKASLHYRRACMIDGEIFISTSEIKDIKPRVASWTRRVSKRNMSDTSFSTPEQAKRFRCSPPGEKKTDMECPQEFKDGDDGNDNEPFRSESNTYDGFTDLLDPNNQGLQAADDIEYDIILQKLFE